MEDLSVMVSKNLKRIREERKLSLDKLSDMTGVSKSMLGQIERGESSPTISVVWKIANGLKTSFTTLLSAPRSNASMVRKESIQPLLEDNGKYRLYSIFPMEQDRTFEIYQVEIDPGGSLSAEPHPDATQEFILVTEGVLTVTANEQQHSVAMGDSIRFQADCLHSYLNSGNDLLSFTLVIHYPS